MLSDSLIAFMYTIWIIIVLGLSLYVSLFTFVEESGFKFFRPTVSMRETAPVPPPRQSSMEGGGHHEAINSQRSVSGPSRPPPPSKVTARPAPVPKDYNSEYTNVAIYLTISFLGFSQNLIQN